jgi:hypothetical protein
MRSSTTFWISLTGGVLFLAPAFAQRADTYRAQIRGGGGDRGKCTIEVEVDGVAEIEIRGDQGAMRTLSGGPSAWRRMECNQPLPANPYNFHFSGVDGRGRQTLLRDPSNNRGTAVVRIEDPQGGREGYTFDIEWSGTSGYSGGGGGYRGDGGFDRGGPGGDRWNDEIRFRGRGDGNFNNFRGPDDRLYDCEVTVDRRGEVTVTFQTERRSRLTFNGRLTRFDRDSISADMSGMGVRGSMEIRYSGRNRVTDISMSAVGRERFELRWHR